MRQGVLRTRKDGGTSICYAPEDKIGHRRCCHVMDNAAIKVQKAGSTNFINISGQVNGRNTSFDIEASEDKIKHYKDIMEKEKKNSDFPSLFKIFLYFCLNNLRKNYEKGTTISLIDVVP